MKQNRTHTHITRAYGKKPTDDDSSDHNENTKDKRAEQMTAQNDHLLSKHSNRRDASDRYKHLRYQMKFGCFYYEVETRK